MQLSSKKIIEIFKKNAKKTAIIYLGQDNSISKIKYSKMLFLVKSGTCFFKKNNYHVGDSISYLLDNSPEMLIIDLISLFNGYRSCPLDVRCDTEDVIYKKLQQTQPKVFLYRKKFISEEFIAKVKNNLKIKTFSIENTAALDLLFENNTKSVFNKKSKKNTVLIIYTSGTTGFPKGVMLSENNIYRGAEQVIQWLKINSDDIFYIVLPLYHINSIMYSLSTLFVGGTVAIPSRYSSSGFFNDVARYKATLTSIVPTINYDLLKQKEIYKKNKKNIRLRLVQIGSAPVSATHAIDFYRNFNIPLIQGYGLTETTHRITGVPINLDNETYLQLLGDNSIGKPQIHSHIKIVNSNTNIEIDKENIVGEIIVSGKNIMENGYLNLESKTKEVIINSYFHTGDIGYFKYINKEKYFFILGRSKEIIIKGGINISPIFIEEQLRKTIDWADEIVVVGFSHYRYGEEIGVVLVPKKGTNIKTIEIFADQLANFKFRLLSKYETPQSYVITSSEKISKTQIGKVQHIKVKEFFMEKLLETYQNKFSK